MRTGTRYSKTVSTMMWFMALLLVVFTAGCDRDHGTPATTPLVKPTVTFVTPANATPNVAINRKVTATFSMPMNAATITAPGTFTLTGPFVTAVTGTVTYDALSSTATFSSTGNLLNNTTYSATIATVAKNTAGTALAAPFVWSFSTAAFPDITPPVVSFTAPANGDTSVAANRMIVATFNEAMDPATIIVSNVTVTGPSGAVSGAVTYAAGSFAMTFDPTANLASSATYTVTITGVTGVKDLAGNFMAANYTWSFTTAGLDTTAPRISSTDPIDLAVGVPTNKQISATFTEAMAPLTIITANFTLMEGLTPVTGTVAYDVLNNVATFTPLSLLTPSTTYTARVTNGATDLAGNALVAGLVPNPWTFTTAALPGVDLGILAPFGVASYGGLTNSGATKINGDVVLDPTATCNAVAVGAADDFGLCGGTPPTNNPGDLVITQTHPDTTTADAVMVQLLVMWNHFKPSNMPGATVLGCGTIGTGGGAGGGIGCALNATLPPGVYISASNSTIDVTGDLTLDGGGNPNALFVFQAPSALNTAVSSRILLTNGTKASNVFWFVGSSASLLTGSEFEGSVLASASISMGTGATSCGRLLAGAEGSGAFTFLGNTVSVPAHPNAPVGCQ